MSAEPTREELVRHLRTMETLHVDYDADGMDNAAADLLEADAARIAELEALLLRMVSWNERKNRSSVEALVARDSIIRDYIRALPLLHSAEVKK